MGNPILPSGEKLNTTPDEVLQYINPDGLRQIFRQERLRWNLKPSRDVDYYDTIRLFKYTSQLYNMGLFQKMELRTFPDNNAYAGYAGITVDSGLYGFVHDIEKWSKAVSRESVETIVNRVMIGAMAKIPGKTGYGLDDNLQEVTNTDNRMAALEFDPFDGRIYAFTNDDPNYVNNESRSPSERIPERAVARIGDIPTRITHLKNDLDFVSDPDYHHTENSFTNSNRFLLDNIDDRTFVYPEISKDVYGQYIPNIRMGLNGIPGYGESDGDNYNTQPDLGDLSGVSDRDHAAINSYNTNQNFSGLTHSAGFLPGVFKSYEELLKVDLVGQKMPAKTQKNSPGAKRPQNYYIHDGKWSPTWFDREGLNDSYKHPSQNPSNMELISESDTEPTPYNQLSQTSAPYSTQMLYQWRYNRVTVLYYSRDVVISIEESGEEYKVGDRLRWTFGDDVFMYEVLSVGPNGQIQDGKYYSERERVFEQDPSTHGVGLPFSNTSGVGRGALLSLSCKATIETNATQLKNNLYAYVDITPTVRSDNTSQWSDVNKPDSQGGRITVRSTAAGPAYSGINSGRGGASPNPSSSTSVFHEHGGNATAGVHLHLFRYVIDTQNPTYVEENGVKVYTGRWVDQGPMGLERPCDIKALLFSNPDTNNFNNYYKFMIDSYFDNLNRKPDAIETGNPNALSTVFLHVDEQDPTDDRRFYDTRFDPDTSELIEVDVTDKVIYVNAATGVFFIYNSGFKNDPSYGYGSRNPGWISIAGTIAR